MLLTLGTAGEIVQGVGEEHSCSQALRYKKSELNALMTCFALTNNLDSVDPLANVTMGRSTGNNVGR